MVHYFIIVNDIIFGLFLVFFHDVICSGLLLF